MKFVVNKNTTKSDMVRFMEINFKMLRGFAKKTKPQVLEVMKKKGVDIVYLNKVKSKPVENNNITLKIEEKEKDIMSILISKLKEEVKKSLENIDDKELLRKVVLGLL